MNLQQQALALLKIADDYRAGHCRALLATATVQSRALIRQAQIAARRDVRSALAPDVERLAAQVAADEAQLGTLRRMHERQRLAALLEQAWPRVAQALRDRWQTPAGRASWVTASLSIASRALPAHRWVIQHPEHWPAQEREQAGEWLHAHGIDDVQFEADAELPAGIRVVCGLNVLDASLDGLLADRAQVEGRLLHHLGQEQ